MKFSLCLGGWYRLCAAVLPGGFLGVSLGVKPGILQETASTTPIFTLLTEVLSNGTPYLGHTLANSNGSDKQN